ncbi:AraC family transcriptional regulator [Hwangdonia lutea]|uniref:Helix-turn-helix transcriptional regulator n=1 Tax=Hwangdonia lutea TaxID=3075823 RepID=A0AA97ER12_9FLAO|nr:helix-turn-helix transcriptional regulator [Hwangdonia sp. SCSIO 19198]WOD44620.1 helix-turn-helix transcriptional regulator [Hwangdonia sp. SCSIO 19198]
MKVLPFKIPKPENDAFIFQVDYADAFYDKLHQHEEIQISFIVEGEGTLIVGDTINDYTKDDILIIGSNIPHVFKSDLNASGASHMLSLFFTKQSFGLHFFELDTLNELGLFFKRAKHGFKITSKKNRFKELFFEIEKVSKLNRFIILLQLLKLASICNYKSLSSFIYDKKYSDNEGHRMRNVFTYTMDNFENDITLNTIAEVANMTKNAFCKYFKKRTNKTYIQFLNELRLEHACKLLLSNKDLTVSEVAEKSGFNNMSNFNRQFKVVKKVNPSEYRKQNL